ncbi:MAG TPA: beta-ketoacyl-[acyl-carrier-protein] synthase family protein [Kofleriaceae bacterium]|nr:beta-ketoacyl-[acyl-carrier-protein] synthase family protein [Kofleriaceae bacterium]
MFVRGVGAYTPLAATWPDTARQLARGATGIAPITAFDATGFPCTVAAAIAGDDALEDRRLAFAERAAREAWQTAGPVAGRLGVFVGAESGRGRFSTVLGLAQAARGSNGKFDHARFGREARAFAERIDASVISPSAVASALAAQYGATGPVETVSLACASGSAAIVEAARAVRLGEIDVALCGGVGADVDPLMLAGFGLLGILSERGVSCPFDVRRDGFVVGEGAAMLVLSAEPGDAAVELAGVGRSLDAHHLTAPDPDGDGAARAMTAALADAGVRDVGCVGYVQAHGTSTPLNDRIEIAAIRRVGLADAHVSSAKGALGHWVAGAGAVGALYAWHAVAHGLVLPTAGLVEPDDQCAAHHVIGEAIAKRVDVALANSFAFGGANSCLVMRRHA